MNGVFRCRREHLMNCHLYQLMVMLLWQLMNLLLITTKKQIRSVIIFNFGHKLNVNF